MAQYTNVSKPTVKRTVLEGAPDIASIYPRPSENSVRIKYADQIAALHTPFECENCNEIHTLIEALGRRQCQYHPGRRDRDTWTCCKHDAKRLTIGGFVFGCTPCDHRDPDEPQEQRQTLKLPYELYAVIQANLPVNAVDYSIEFTSISTGFVDFANSYVVIPRTSDEQTIYTSKTY